MNKGKSSRNLAAALLAAIMIIPAIPGAATAAPSLEEIVVEMATTPAQHEAVAEYYREKAAEARAEVTRHQRMKAAYNGGKAATKAAMANHCSELIKNYEAAAASYDALAAEHEALAKGN